MLDRAQSDPFAQPSRCRVQVRTLTGARFGVLVSCPHSCAEEPKLHCRYRQRQRVFPEISGSRPFGAQRCVTS